MPATNTTTGTGTGTAAGVATTRAAAMDTKSAQRRKKKFGLKRLFRRKKGNDEMSVADSQISQQIQQDKRSVQFGEAWAKTNTGATPRSANTSTAGVSTGSGTATATGTGTGSGSSSTSHSRPSVAYKDSPEQRLSTMPKPWLARNKFFRTMVEHWICELQSRISDLWAKKTLL